MPTLKKAVAQEERRVVKDHDQIKRNLETQFPAIRKIFKQQAESDIPMPQQVRSDHPAAKKLLKTLKDLNELIRPYNKGKDAVPVDVEILNPKNLVELDNAAKLALGRISAAALGKQLDETAPSKVKEAVAVAPPTTGVVPRRVLRPEQRKEYQDLVGRLDFIVKRGTGDVQKTAKDYQDRLKEGLGKKNLTPAEMLELGKLADDTDRFVSKEQIAVAKAAAERKVAEMEAPTREAEKAVAKKAPEEAEKPPVAKPPKPTFEEEQGKVEETIKSLNYVAEQHPAKGQRKKAEKNSKRLAKVLEKVRKKGLTSKRAKALEKMATRLTPSEAVLTAAETNEINKAPSAMKPLDKARKHHLFGKYDQLSTSLKDMTKDTSKRDMAHKIRQQLPTVWQLGEKPMETMLELLSDATNALKAGKTDEAEAKLNLAVNRDTSKRDVFNAEQRMYDRIFIAPAIAIADAAVKEAKGKPTRKQMKDAEKRHRQDGEEYVGEYSRMTRHRRTKKALHNGSEDIARAMEAVRKNAEQYVKDNKGELSFHFVSDLYDNIARNERTLRGLSDLWNYAHTGKPAETIKKDKELRMKLWENYGIGAMTLVDPNFFPYDAYSRERLEKLVAQHIRATTGVTPSLKQVRAAKDRIVASLQRSREYRHDDVIFGVYDAVRRAAPKELFAALPKSSADTLNESVHMLAELEALLVHYETEYSPYVMKLTSLPTGEALNLESKERFEKARNALQQVVDVAKARAEASGLDEKEQKEKYGVLIEPAEEMLKAYSDAALKKKPLPAERIPAVSDTLYHAAMGLAAITKAELWIDNPGNFCRSMTTKEIRGAMEAIEWAKKMYVFNFGKGLKLDPAYNPNLPRILADAATIMITPTALALLDAPARFSIIGAYASPGEEIDVKDLFKPTQEERMKASVHAAKDYVRMLISLRTNDAFGTSMSDKVLRDAGYTGAVALLSPAISRVEVPEEVIARRRTTVSEIDQYLSHDYTPHELVGEYRWGQLFVEAEKQRKMREDDDTPAILKKLDAAPLIVVMENLAAAYPYNASGKQLEGENGAVVVFFGKRTKEIEERLKAEVEIKGLGKKVSLSAIGDAELSAPGFFRIAMAKKVLLPPLQASDKKLGESLGQDLSTRSGISPRMWIAIAESIHESLDDSHIPKTITDKDKEELLRTEEAFFLARIPEPDTTRKYGVEHLVYGINNMVVFVQKKGKPKTRKRMRLGSYEGKYGEQDISVYWLAFQKIGGEWYLYNPNHDVSKPKEEQIRHVGVIMEDVTLVNKDGVTVMDEEGKARKGNFVVRVRPPEPGEGDTPVPLLWKGKEGKVDIENVLFQVEEYEVEGETKFRPTGDDKMFDILSQNLEGVAMIREISDTVEVARYGETKVTVIPHSHGKKK